MDFLGFSRLNLAYFLLFFSVNSRLNLGLFFCTAIKQQGTENRSIRWCPGSLQLANSLTKRGAQPHILLDTLQFGQLNLEG